MKTAGMWLWRFISTIFLLIWVVVRCLFISARFLWQAAISTTFGKAILMFVGSIAILVVVGVVAALLIGKFIGVLFY